MMKLLCAATVLAVASAEASELREAAAKITGAWTIEYTTPDDETREDIVLLGRERERLVAWRVTEQGRQPFEEVVLQGETLSLTIEPEETNGAVTVTLKARQSGEGACSGVIEYIERSGDTGQLDFQGKKIDPRDLEQVSQWKLDFVGPDNVRRQPVVTAVSHQGNDYAWYRGEEFDLPATAFSVEGDKATMRVDVTTAGGERLGVTLHGEIDGDHVAGEATWKTKYDDGAFPFSGVMEKSLHQRR